MKPFIILYTEIITINIILFSMHSWGCRSSQDGFVDCSQEKKNWSGFFWVLKVHLELCPHSTGSLAWKKAGCGPRDPIRSAGLKGGAVCFLPPLRLPLVSIRAGKTRALQTMKSVQAGFKWVMPSGFLNTSRNLRVIALHCVTELGRQGFPTPWAQFLWLNLLHVFFLFFF